MFFVQFTATPRVNARTAPESAGARVCCWIERLTLEEAIRVGRSGIQDEGWIVGEPDEAFTVDASNYPIGHDARGYFEQAMIDKEVFLFYTVPVVDDKSASQ